MGTQLQKQLLLSERPPAQFPAHPREFSPPVTDNPEDLRPSSCLHLQKQPCRQKIYLIKHNMSKTFEICLWIPEMFMFREVTGSQISQAHLWMFVQNPCCPSNNRNSWSFFLPCNVGILELHHHTFMMTEKSRKSRGFTGSETQVFVGQGMHQSFICLEKKRNPFQIHTP